MSSPLLRPSDFEALTDICDGFLLDPAAPAALLATPSMHVVSSHPVLIRLQCRDPDGLVASAAQMARHLRNVLQRARPKALAIDRLYDVILVGGLVSAQHLEGDSDFYFGGIQKYLTDAGLSSLLMLRNQTGLSTSGLRDRARRDGERGRLLLPDVLSAAEELALIRIARAALRASKGRLRQVQDDTLRANLTADIASPSTTGNLRLESLVRQACRIARPTAVVTMLEGHAWERCVYRAARARDPKTIRVGYQHTIIRKHAHGIRRGLGTEKDPDLVLCMGPASCRDLSENSTIRDAAFHVFGTPRMQRDPGGNARDPDGTCLILPEGLQDEAHLLFSTAISAARMAPDLRFLFRCHPIMPYHRIEGLPSPDQFPPNVRLSTRTAIEDDFERASTILYRGSSAVVYGILSGLRPFYLEVPNELTLDPIHALREWRERVSGATDLIEALATDSREAKEDREAAWAVARGFCANMSVAERPEGLASLVERIERARHVRN